MVFLLKEFDEILLDTVFLLYRKVQNAFRYEKDAFRADKKLNRFCCAKILNIKVMKITEMKVTFNTDEKNNTCIFSQIRQSQV